MSTQLLRHPLSRHPSTFLALAAATLLATGCTKTAKGGPGMDISAEALDFGVVPIDTAVSLDFTIENTGTTAFDLLSASLIEGSSSLWTIEGSSSLTLESEDLVTVTVTFAPFEQGQAEGRIQVRTTFEDEPTRYIEIVGVGGESVADDDEDGFSPADGDCRDTDASVYPGAPELCDGKDNDCDGAPGEDEVDADYDGFYLCSGDCNDEDETIHPGAREICDGEDTDCDGAVQDYLDGDRDSYSICNGDCADDDDTRHPGNPEICDGVDNDCKGSIDDIDEDGDGYSPCDNGGDCDDNDYFAYPVVVDPSAPEGGDGSWEDPYSSLEAGFAGLDAVCRTIVLAEGRYEMSRSWTAGTLTLVGAGLDVGDVVLTPPEDEPVFTVSSGAHLTLRNLEVSGAVSSEDGGALRASGADLTLEGVLVTDNTCTDCDGGAVAVSSGALSLSGCTISDNTSGDDGGAVVVLFGDLSDYGSIYTGNRGARGGAIRAESSTVWLDGTLFDGNNASSDGGAVSLVGGTGHRLERSTFWLNTAAIYGGALSLTGVTDTDSWLRNLVMLDNVAGSAGGGVAVTGSRAGFVFANNTLAVNQAKSRGEGGGMYMAVDSADDVLIWSNVFYYNDGDSGLYVKPGSGASVAYNTAFATTSGNNLEVDAGEDAGNNASTDPGLASITNNGDPTDDDVSVSTGSSARNSGPQDGTGPDHYTDWSDTDGSRNDRGATGGPGATEE